MQQFNIKSDIYLGDKALEILAELPMKKVCIATDPILMAIGLTDSIISILKDRNIEFRVFQDIQPDPDTTAVTQGLVHFMEFQPDTIIALGGGSVIDTAKALLYFNQKLADGPINYQGIPRPRFVAIPTTSGTGSEVTQYAVVTDKVSGRKYPLTGSMMIPDIAILDSRLTQGAPVRLSVETGIDALTHAVEAFVSTQSNPFSKAFAVTSIRGILDNLPKLISQEHSDSARDTLHSAASMAGIAFSNAGLGLTHSLAHSLVKFVRLSHGAANGLFLIPVILYNLSDPESAALYKDLAVQLFRPEATENDLLAAIEDLYEQVDFNAILASQMGEDDLMIIQENLSTIITFCAMDPCTETNPVPLDPDSLFLYLKNYLEIP